MKTYDTYQEAKIANPYEDVKTDNLGNFFVSVGHTLCKPADYCMRVETFLTDGRKFVDGDSYLDWKGRFSVVGSPGFEKDACNDIRNVFQADQAFILRSAALEKQMNIDNLATQTPEAKKEREELADAACENMFGESIQNCRPDVAATVRCMIEAGYRKGSK